MKFGKKERLPGKFGIKKKFLEKKKVLITGNLGFKGSWLCLQLSFLEKVFGIDDESANSSLIKKNI